MTLAKESGDETRQKIAAWSASAGLRLAPARVVPKKDPRWLLSVATVQKRHGVAA
jgi:hypothetical protein